ncbi:hypothetical protein [Yinghuangia sp. YIM S09857]|uniref:hypothetical protein n=1 Tax=Yinghuangia sp. YIM S09857 TaxID=3436929 RepID=UPI003F52CFC5
MKIRHADSRWSFELTQYRDADGGYSVTVRLFGKAEHMAEATDPHVAMTLALGWALERDGKVRFSRVYAIKNGCVIPEGSVLVHPKTAAHFEFTHLSATRTAMVGRDSKGEPVSYRPAEFGLEVRDEWEPEADQ